MSRDQFLAAADAGFFLEWEEFNGNLYGTPLSSVESGRVLLLEIDAKGARTVRGISPTALIIALEPPSLATLGERMTQRGDDPSQIERRLAIAADEMVLAREVADFLLVNTELHHTVDMVVSMIEDWLTLRI